MRPSISAYIITLNEEDNIARAIESVSWMDEVVVLDSGSTDDTLAIAQRLGAKTAEQAFSGFSVQKNSAMDMCTSEWVFNLDADEEVTPELADSIKRIIELPPSSETDTYEVCRKTWYLGRWIEHCGWYPEFRSRLNRKGSARWTGGTLHERLESATPPGRLDGDFLHRPYRNLEDHIATIAQYSSMWAEQQATAGNHATISNMLLHPAAKFVKMYILRGGFRDAIPGLIASIMGAVYVFMKYARLYELQRKES